MVSIGTPRLMITSPFLPPKKAAEKPQSSTGPRWTEICNVTMWSNLVDEGDWFMTAHLNQPDFTTWQRKHATSTEDFTSWWFSWSYITCVLTLTSTDMYISKYIWLYKYTCIYTCALTLNYTYSTSWIPWWISKPSYRPPTPEGKTRGRMSMDFDVLKLWQFYLPGVGWWWRPGAQVNSKVPAA